MSQQPPSPPGPGMPPGPPYAAPSSRKPPPKKMWWFVGGGLIVLSVVVGITLFVLVLSSSMKTDSVAALSSDGTGVTMKATPGEKRMLFTSSDSRPECAVTDAQGPVPATRVSGTITVSNSSREWTGVSTFTPRGSAVEVTCVGAPSGTELRIGAPLGAAFAGGIAAMILIPMFLGGLGFVILLVTLILTLTRRK